MKQSSKSASHDTYTNPEFVAAYSKNTLDNAWNAYYERPASLSLLPDLKNKNILDAGCGSGVTADIFINNGAVVTAIDYSAEMVRLAKERTNGQCSVSVVDMNNGLPMFNDSEFDIIYSSLVIHYIDDLESLFRDFSRILKSDGLLIFSTDHPELPEFKENPITEKRLNEVFWDSYNIYMQIYERPWTDIISALEDNHFHIEKTLTPFPTEECKLKYPEQYDYLSENPSFICVKSINRKAQ